jgi:hypothetical protein
MTLASNSVLNIVAGGGDGFNGLVLTNYGTVNWTNTPLYGIHGSNAQIYNYGLWNVQSDETFAGGNSGGTSLFDNFGTFTKSGGINTAVLDGNVVFNNTGTVNVESGTLELNGGGASSGGDFTTASAGIINIYGYTFTGTNTFTGPGTYVAGGQATFGGTIAGTLNWDGGSLAGTATLSSSSVLNIVAGGGDGFNGLVLTNYGTVNWTNTPLYGVRGNNAQIYNYGLWNAQSGNMFVGGNSGGTTLFDNFGTFLKSGDTDAAILDGGVVFNNTGTVTVESGSLNIGQGTSSGGNFTTSGAGILNFSSFTFANTNTFTGSGNYVAGGATFAGTIAGTLNWDGGSLNGVLTVASDSFFNIGLGGANGDFYGLTLTNYGTVTWTNTTLYGENDQNAQIYNYGLWNAQGDNMFVGANSGGTSLFDNFGTFLKSGNTGATILDSSVLFNNTGTVSVQSGTLSINGGGVNSGSGTFTTANGGLLDLFGMTFANSATISSATVVDLGGNTTIAGVLTATNLQLVSGTLGGTNVLQGTLTWSGGRLAGVLTLAGNSVLNIVAGGGDGFNGLVLTNYGTVNWTNSTIYSQGPGNAQIYNYGLWNAQSDNIFQGGYSGGTTLFDNFGTFLKSGGTNTTVLDGDVVFNNTGTVNVESGSLELDGGGASSGGDFTTASAGIINIYGYTFTDTNTFTGPGTYVAGGQATFGGTIAGTLNWDGGSLAGTAILNSNSVLNIVAGGGNGFNGLVLTNYGTVNWTNTPLYGIRGNNAQIYNYGLWNAQSGNMFVGGNNEGTTLFDNFGTFLKSGDTGAASLDNSVVFNNTGTVNVQSGSLNIGQGTSSGGNFTTSGAGILNFSSFTFANTNTFTGNGSYVAGGATFAGTVAGTLNWDGGSLNGVLTVAGNSFFNIGLGGADGDFYGLTLTNYGTVAWTNTPLYGENDQNAQIYNYGLWNAQSDNAFGGGNHGGTSLFDNFGTFLKSGNTGSTVLDGNVLFNNTGTVTVESGSLNIGRGTSSGGNFTTAGGQTVNVSSFTFTNTNTFIGSGSYVAGGATFAGTIAGTLNWDGGSLNGVLTVASNSFFNIGLEGADGAFYGLTLTNYGTVTWTNTPLYGENDQNAQIYNYGLWNAQSDNIFVGGNHGGTSLFDNFGTFLKSGNTGATVLDSGVVFNNTGTVQANSGTVSFVSPFIQNTGETVLNGGNFAFSQLAQFLGGTLTGAGAITGSVSNNAAIGTGATPGLLAISGNYTEGPNAHLAIKLGGTSAGANYDQLSVGGNASLAGSLDVSYWNGFTPAASNVFTVLACSALAGQFSAVTSPGNGLDAVYGATNVQVVLHHPPPVAHLTVPAQALAGHTFAVAGSATCLEGAVTNLALLLGTNVLVSAPGSSASVNYSSDFPGNLTFTAVALASTGAQGQTNTTMTITTLPLLTLDALGFQTNRAFKFLMLGQAGTNYQVQTSTNLALTNWTALGTMESTNGIWRYFDTTATNFLQRFYRIWQLP